MVALHAHQKRRRTGALQIARNAYFIKSTERERLISRVILRCR
jgi:hypothetical protein